MDVAHVGVFLFLFRLPFRVVRLPRFLNPSRSRSAGAAVARQHEKQHAASEEQGRDEQVPPEPEADKN